MKSYDRLFPNQDNLPRGGFASLTPLPLQYEPRQQGNTVFIDERFRPFTNFHSGLATPQACLLHPGASGLSLRLRPRDAK